MNASSADGNRIRDDLVKRRSIWSIEASCESEIRQIDSALHCLSDGQYGVCEACGREIAAERINALPSATNCGDCAAEKVSVP